jgi:hypothetical protein
LRFSSIWKVYYAFGIKFGSIKTHARVPLITTRSWKWLCCGESFKQFILIDTETTNVLWPLDGKMKPEGWKEGIGGSFLILSAASKKLNQKVNTAQVHPL